MCGLQCSKKLWQAVYDPEPAEKPLPGTAKGMGIEVGIKARRLWPGGVLVDDPGHHRYDAVVRCTVRRQGFRDNGLDKIKGGSGSSGW
jgi:hypothetical protein